MSVNLWNPSGHLPMLAVLVTSILLGMVHGVTPDEHTWPITFSYSVGSYSSRGGRKAGFLFSAAFTLQRALASELAYFTLTRFEFAKRWGFEVYMIVGLVMLLSGYYILRRGTSWHLFSFHSKAEQGHAVDPRQNNGTQLVEPKPLPRFMPLVHGFIAGWGVGAFALIIYSVLSPSMPSAWLGWMPGALFGLGTMVMQMLLGSLFGAWMARRKLSDQARVYIARKMSGRTLAGGGIGFILVAILGLAFPDLVNQIAIVTPIQIHNLHTLGAGFFLAVIVLFSVALWAFWKSKKEVVALSS
ncbi:MAG: hypothetical protein ACYCVB_18310 [Bacilli bacterium]